MITNSYTNTQSQSIDLRKLKQNSTMYEIEAGKLSSHSLVRWFLKIMLQIDN